MTKNDKCLNELITKVKKLKENSDKIIYVYEKNPYVKPVPVIYSIINGIDSLYNGLVVALNEKREEKEHNDTKKTCDK
jgi:hypothetical protein